MATPKFLSFGFTALIGCAALYSLKFHPLGQATKPKLKVFVLPHSHDDVGWVRTPNQYYNDFVKYIYTTAVEALAANPARKFQSVEQAYFSRWWDDADARQRSLVKQFIKEGRFEFAVGGWVMPDEATTDYWSLIETMTLGHEFIYNTFGVRPRFGFQVDPFGASSNFAWQSAKFGFDAHIISRINSWWKSDYQARQKLEFVWHPGALDGGSVPMFTHIMDQYSYCVPWIPLQLQLRYLCNAQSVNASDCPGGNFEWDGDDSQPALAWQNNPPYPGVNSSNVEFYADFFVNNTRQRAQWFATPNLLWPFGCDFQHFNSTRMFASMDQIIAHVNSHNGAGQRYEGVEVQYATLSDYFGAVKGEERTWDARGSEDFMAYSSGEGEGVRTWTGYYSSHEQLKGLARSHSALLRAADTLLATAGQLAVGDDANSTQNQQQWQALSALRRAVATLQHHDAMTGTEGVGNGVPSDTVIATGKGTSPGSGSGSSSGPGDANGPQCSTGSLEGECGVYRPFLYNSSVNTEVDTEYPGNVGQVVWSYSRMLDTGRKQAEPVLADAMLSLLADPTPFRRAESVHSTPIPQPLQPPQQQQPSAVAADVVGEEDAADATAATPPKQNEASPPPPPPSTLSLSPAALWQSLQQEGAAAVTVYNPLAWQYSPWVRVPLPTPRHNSDGSSSPYGVGCSFPSLTGSGSGSSAAVELQVFDASGAAVATQVLPTGGLLCPDETCTSLAPSNASSGVNTGGSDGSGSLLFFRAPSLPPLGARVFTVRVVPTAGASCTTGSTVYPSGSGSSSSSSGSGSGSSNSAADANAAAASPAATAASTAPPSTSSPPALASASSSVTVSNAFFALSFDAATAQLQSITDLTAQPAAPPLPLHHALMEYRSASNVTQGAVSGSYVFRPLGPAQPIAQPPVPPPLNGTARGSGSGSGSGSAPLSYPRLVVVRGAVVQEVWQLFSPYHSAVFRLYGAESTDSAETTDGSDGSSDGSSDGGLGAAFVEVEFALGPLIGNTEVITRFTSGLDTTGPPPPPSPSNLPLPSDRRSAPTAASTAPAAPAAAAAPAVPVFYSDSNGAQWQRRAFNGSLTPQFRDAGMVISGNYAPITRSAFIRGPPATAATYATASASASTSRSYDFTLLTARSHGACSTASGELELMLHRRELQDDSLGACFHPNETTTRPDGCPANRIPLNTTSRVFPRIWLTLAPTDDAAAAVRTLQLAQRLNNPPLLLFTSLQQQTPQQQPPQQQPPQQKSAVASGVAAGGVDALPPALQSWVHHYGGGFAPMAQPLPPASHLLTLRRRGGDNSTSLLLRLQHIAMGGDAPTPTGMPATAATPTAATPSTGQHGGLLTQPAAVDLASAFPAWQMGSLQERSLSTVWPLHSLTRWAWKTAPHTNTATAATTDSPAPTDAAAAAAAAVPCGQGTGLRACASTPPTTAQQQPPLQEGAADGGRAGLLSVAPHDVRTFFVATATAAAPAALTTADIVAIVVGSVLLAAGLAALVWYFLLRPKGGEDSAQAGYTEVSLY